MAATFAVVALCFLLSGWVYWSISSHSDGFRCVYDDPTCSITVATWLLIFVGFFAFIAAFAAAKFSASTYEMESRTQLGQTRCTNAQSHGVLVTLYLLETNMTVLVDAVPPDFNQAAYHEPEDHDFENLGRAAIIQAQVSVIFESPDGKDKSKPRSIALGNIGRDKHVHVRVYISKKLDKIITTWLPEVKHKGNYKLPFYPYNAVVEEKVAPFSMPKKPGPAK